MQVPLCSAASVSQLERGQQVEEENRAAEGYMRELYQQVADENGKPKSGADFSSVRCFTGTGEQLKLLCDTCP